MEPTADFPYELAEHAVIAMRERAIQLVWVKDILEHPTKIEQDSDDLQLEHALGEIPEAGNRVLRVVYNHSTKPWRIVTVYFDRSMKGRL